jgi:hypothetical protein
MSVPQLHNIVATACSIYALIIGLWALFTFLRKTGLSGEFFGAVVIGEILMVAQAVLGGILLLQGLVPARPIHYLYGAVAVLTWPATYTYLREQPERRAHMWWMIVSLFLFGITLRAGSTALSGG